MVQWSGVLIMMAWYWSRSIQGMSLPRFRTAFQSRRIIACCCGNSPAAQRLRRCFWHWMQVLRISHVGDDFGLAKPRKLRFVLEHMRASPDRRPCAAGPRDYGHQAASEPPRNTTSATLNRLSISPSVSAIKVSFFAAAARAAPPPLSPWPHRAPQCHCRARDAAGDDGDSLRQAAWPPRLRWRPRPHVLMPREAPFDPEASSA